MVDNDVLHVFCSGFLFLFLVVAKTLYKQGFYFKKL